MKKALTVLALVTTAALVFVWSQTPRLPEGLADAGAAYDVEIIRDQWGVPHIFGKTDADAAYGLAYAHAEDDFATIQGALLAARGKLASVFGQAAAPNDYMVHLLRVWEAVDAGYPTLDAATRAVCEAYADGLNHFAARHPDAAHAGLYPVTGRDVVAGFVHKLPLFFGLGEALTALFADEAPPEADAARAFFALPDDTIGSNAFAVAPSRTADGSTFLAINSHQPWSGPVAWYEAHLHSDDGWDMVGGVFPGAPVILHGHNPHLGWAHTVNRPDLLDVYVLDVDPNDPDRYRFDGGWRTLETRAAPIEVKLLGPLRWTFTREVLWSEYGPVVRQPHGTYALRFAGLGEVRQVEQWYRMNKATSFEAWKEAMRLTALPMFHTVYADAEGHIFYVYNGRLPLRTEGYDYTGYLPGDTSATRWTEHLPFEALPQVLDPPSGFVQNANSSPYVTTLGPGNPDSTAFSSTFGIETHQTNRSMRALALFGADSSITEDDFYRYKYDMAYAPGSVMAGLMADVLSAPAPADSLLRSAREVLRAWDLRVDPANPHAALAVMAFQPFLMTYDATPPPDTLLAHLADAAETLDRHFGTLTPPWADVNRLRRGDLDVGLGGAPDVLHAIHSAPADDGRLVGHAGDAYVLLVGWDAEGRVRSRSIHQYGSATLDAASPHFADQAPLFVRRQLKPVWLDEAALRLNPARIYRPGAE